jgi:hypothetical protein
MAKPSVKAAFVDGEQTLIANLEVYAEQMTDAVADGMRKFGGRVEGESTRRCPVEFSELRSRIFNEGPLRDGDVYVQVVGYEKFGELWGKENSAAAGKAYALPVHERTDVQHPVGEAKFLENAVNHLSGEYAKYLQKLLKGVKPK